MNKIHDPRLDGMFANGSPQQQPVMAVASPLNDVQLLSQMASDLIRNGVGTGEAIDLAFTVLAEVAVRFHEFPKYVEAAKQRQEMRNAGPTQ